MDKGEPPYKKKREEIKKTGKDFSGTYFQCKLHFKKEINLMALQE